MTGSFGPSSSPPLAFCIVHAARRAFRQPKPTEIPSITSPSAKEEEEMERHTLFQRIFHWTNALAVFTLPERDG